MRKPHTIRKNTLCKNYTLPPTRQFLDVWLDWYIRERPQFHLGFFETLVSLQGQRWIANSVLLIALVLRKQGSVSLTNSAVDDRHMARGQAAKFWPIWQARAVTPPNTLPSSVSTAPALPPPPSILCLDLDPFTAAPGEIHWGGSLHISSIGSLQYSDFISDFLKWSFSSSCWSWSARLWERQV